MEVLIISMSIDAVDVDSPEGNGVESIWMRGFSGLNVGDGGGCDFLGVARYQGVFCGEFVVECGELVVVCVVVKTRRGFFWMLAEEAVPGRLSSKSNGKDTKLWVERFERLR